MIRLQMPVMRTQDGIEGIRRRINEAVAMDPDLDGVDLRVFLYLSARIDIEEFVHIPQLEMAMALGRRKEHISRSIRKLTERGLVISSPKGTRSSEWKLNQNYGK